MDDSDYRRPCARRWGRWAAAVTLATLCSLAAGGLASANSPSSPPSYAFEVGHGAHAKGDSWSIWLYGNREGRQCWWTQLVQGGLPQRYESCGYAVPSTPWQLASSGTVSRHESVLFFLTRPHLSALKVRIKIRGRPSYRSITVRVHTLAAGEAHAARLHHPIGYALAVIHGQLAEVGSVTVAKR